MSNKSVMILTAIAALLLPFVLTVVAMWIPPDWYSSPVFWASLIIDAVVICTGIVLCRLNRVNAQEQDREGRDGGE